MRIDLNFPRPWELKEAPGGRRIALLPGSTSPDKPDAMVSIGPLVIRPDEPKAWMAQCVTSELPAGMRVRRGKQIERKTQDGWPMQLIEAELLGPNEEVIECRICAFYFFMEHATFALVRTPERIRMEQHGPAILNILLAGRPNWRSSEPLCLAAAWDLEPTRVQPRAKSQLKGVLSNRRATALNEALSELDDALAKEPTAALHLRQGLILLEIGRPAEALISFRAALRLDPSSRAAHFHAGTALGDQDQHEAAIAEWQAAINSDPKFADAHYNIGQALWNQKKFEAALDAFETAYALEPNDLGTLRKVIQCLYALGRIDDGVATRRFFRNRVAAGVDPRARLLTEYVYDQFDGDGFFVHALETLHAAGPVFAVLTFRAVDSRDRPLPAAMLVETSELARNAGTPYVFGVQSRAGFKVVGSFKQMPTYPELKMKALELLSTALIRGG